MRTGVVLDRHGGALEKMLLPFRLGVGGPVAGGRQPLPWIHVEDVVGIYLNAIDDERWTGPVNATAPEPVSNKEFSKALGRALHRPAIAPVPEFAIRLLYGGMAKLVVEGQYARPRRTLELGYRFRHPDLDEALRSALQTLDHRPVSGGKVRPVAPDAAQRPLRTAPGSHRDPGLPDPQALAARAQGRRRRSPRVLLVAIGVALAISIPAITETKARPRRRRAPRRAGARGRAASPS